MSSQQHIMALSSTESLQSRPTSAPAIASTVTPPQPTQILPTDVSSIWSFLLGFTALHDWLKLVVLGGTLEFIRRTFSLAWSTFLSSFFITVHFEGDDDAYDWMMVWLSRQPSWRKARELQVSTRNWGSGGRYMAPDDNVVIPPESGSPDDFLSLESARKLSFLPSFGTIHTFFYKGHPMRVSRDRKYIGEGSTVESLTISIFGRSQGILHSLLRDAQAVHKSEEANRVGVYIADPYNNWRWSGSRPKRPLKSIILDPAVKEMLIEDAQDFLASEAWYAERGIPFRRGYLLHGAPGSGKTSLIHAIAGALNLDIYVISLSKRGLDDATLNELICSLPARSIALMEDIDAAFTHGVNRDGVGLNGGDGDDDEPGGGAISSGAQDSGRGVTLSGLLGAIDGVAAQEGRILFATTNKYHVLDAALIRPGRLDLHIEFHLATSWQAGEIFKCFYPATNSADDDADQADEVALVASAGSGQAQDVSHKDSSSIDEKLEKLGTPQAPPSYSLTESAAASETTPNGIATDTAHKANGVPNGKLANGNTILSVPATSMSRRQAPKLTTRQLNTLAAKFMAQIPSGELSMASIQGHLMSYKTRPEEAVRAAKEFVETERERKSLREREKEAEKEARRKAKELAKQAKAEDKAAAERAATKGQATVASTI